MEKWKRKKTFKESWILERECQGGLIKMKESGGLELPPYNRYQSLNRVVLSSLLGILPCIPRKSGKRGELNEERS